MPQSRVTQRTRQARQPIPIPSKTSKVYPNLPSKMSAVLIGPKRSNCNDRFFRIPAWQNSPPQLDLPGPDDIFGRPEPIVHSKSGKPSVSHGEVDETTGYPAFMRSPSPSTFPAPPADWGRSSNHVCRRRITQLHFCVSDEFERPQERRRSIRNTRLHARAITEQLSSTVVRLASQPEHRILAMQLARFEYEYGFG